VVQWFIKDLLGREVDVVTEKGLHWYIRDRVCREAVPLRVKTVLYLVHPSPPLSRSAALK